MRKTVYLLQFAHTDIGYTHPQDQICWMYLEHYDRVLDLCDATANDPPAHRFKWTCETFWQVEHYLSHRPEQLNRFLAAVRRQQIEITAAYLHFADIIDADAYRRSLLIARDFCQRHRLALRTLLHSDINGWPWSAADECTSLGIEQFLSHVHLDSATDPLGKRGSVHYGWKLGWGEQIRADVPCRRPQAFWWAGPKRGRVLHWLSEHYNLGNELGLSGAHHFGADKTSRFTESDHDTVDALYAIAERRLPIYLEALDQTGYALDIVQLSCSGFFVDNSPPNDRWLRVIQRWNENHEEIQLRTATPSEWFDALREATEIRRLPVHAVAWPDHWAHGLGSSSRRIAQCRQTQRSRAAVEAIVAESDSPAAADQARQAFRSELMAMEHTFNAWCTEARPASPQIEFQQAAKELFFHRATLLQQDAADAALRAMMKPNHPPRLYIQSTTQSAAALVNFDAGDLTLHPVRQGLKDMSGNVHRFQMEHGDLAGFIACLPLDKGLNAFELIDAENRNIDQGPQTRKLGAQPGWTLELSDHSEGLKSLRDPTGRKWMNENSWFCLGQLVHEVVVHPRGRQAVGNAARLIALDSAGPALLEHYPDAAVIDQAVSEKIEHAAHWRGPVFHELAVSGIVPRLGPFVSRWRIYADVPIVELVIELQKQWSDLPEAMYVAFPFAAGQKPAVHLDCAGGTFTPGRHGEGGQLAGTCAAYYTVQTSASIRADDGGTLRWSPLDSPLVVLNQLDTRNWEATREFDWNGLLASMPINHYWHTNFPISQRGPIRLRYQLELGSAERNRSESVKAIGWR